MENTKKTNPVVKFIKDFMEDANLTRLFCIMVLSFVIMRVFVGAKFMTPASLSSMATQFPEIAILAIAVSLAMILGGINLSVVGIANLSAILCCYTVIALSPSIGNWPAIIIGFIVAILCGAICGALNGVLIAYIGIPAMLATLGSQEIFKGLGIAVTKGAAVTGTPDEFTFIGGKIAGIPGPLIVFIIVAIAASILLQRKKFGAELYLVGSNPVASRFSGILNEKVIITTHIYSGILSSIAGILIASKTNAAKASFGSSYVLQCLIIAILGGINPAGGSGKVIGIVMASLTLQFLSSGFTIKRMDGYFTTFVWGAVLVGTMIINYYGDAITEKRKQKKLEKENASQS